MTKKGITAAYSHGAILPTFDSFDEAKSALTIRKDAALASLLKKQGSALQLDWSPDSLKRLEKWFFQEISSISSKEKDIIVHELGFYFGEMLVRNAGFEWVVKEFAFRSGRYEIGVKRGLLRIMLMNGREPRKVNNIRMQSMWRDYKRWAKP